MAKRKPLVAGNWKMNLSADEARRLCQHLAKSLDAAIFDQIDALVCPAYPLLTVAHEALKDTRIKLGAQNVHWEKKGAFTGEISPAMLKEAGCEFCIVGHSERRHIMLESNEMVNRKLLNLFPAGITPILCVGERLDERQANRTLEVVGNQLERAFDHASHAQVASTVIAYEPVWAIGTGVNATPEQAEEVHAFIRDQIGKIAGNDARDSVKILYGGSVTPDNIKGLIAKPNVDGVLVGGASLKADSFERIVRWSMKE